MSLGVAGESGRIGPSTFSVGKPKGQTYSFEFLCT